MKAVLLILDIFTVLIQKTVCEKLFLRKNKTNVFEAAVWMSFFMLSDFLTYILIPSVFANAVIFCVLFSVVLLLLYEGSLKRKIMITEYSCAVKPHIRAGGNRQSGIWETAIASLLA